jgi:hypothetical protein
MLVFGLWRCNDMQIQIFEVLSLAASRGGSIEPRDGRPFEMTSFGTNVDETRKLTKVCSAIVESWQSVLLITVKEQGGV